MAIATAGCSSMGHGWSHANTALEATYIAANLVDWRQTNQGLALAGYDENPVVNKVGSAVYFPVTMIAHAAIAAALPCRWRLAFQAVTTAVELENDRENVAALQTYR